MRPTFFIPRLARSGLHAALALSCLAGSAAAQGMEPLTDSAMSSVRGQDGVSFDLSNFTMGGDARFTYYAPGGAKSAYISNLYATRSDDPANPFGDPYTMDIYRVAGMSDIIELARPQNANGLKRWQYAFDWGVNADGVDFQSGSMVFKDVVYYGGGMQWTPPRSGEGVAFGLGLRMDIGNILLRPRGRDDITQAEPSGVTEQMNLRGLKIGAVDENGVFLNAPWRIANAEKQPGIFRAMTDADGNPRLQIGIDWPDASGAPLGGVQVDNISFRSASGNVDLGSSRIGSIQLQHLDIRLKP